MVEQSEDLNVTKFYDDLYQQIKIPKTINIGQSWGWNIGKNFIHFEIQDYIYFLDIITKILKIPFLPQFLAIGVAIKAVGGSLTGVVSGIGKMGKGIMDAAKNSKDKASAIISYLLKIGFTPTQIADSMAIATGGATFLMNRTKTYLKQGMSQQDADAKAFEDFVKVSDETQQSGDPMLISKQQASHLGRLILAFQNTPMQYVRLMKKAGQDLVNGRGDAKTNISKIMYYGFVQNLLFASLQNALFALLPEFDPDDDDEKRQKIINTKTERIANSMLDTILRGSGLTGAVISTLKNTINRYYKEEAKGFRADHTQTLIELANI